MWRGEERHEGGLRPEEKRKKEKRKKREKWGMSKIYEEKKKEKKNYVGEGACTCVVGKKKGD